jgi:hypothetical protein
MDSEFPSSWTSISQHGEAESGPTCARALRTRSKLSIMNAIHPMGSIARLGDSSLPAMPAKPWRLVCAATEAVLPRVLDLA